MGHRPLGRDTSRFWKEMNEIHNTTSMPITSNRVRDIEKYYVDSLAGIYPEGEIKMFVRMLFEDIMGWSHAELLINRDTTVNQSDLLRFYWAAEDLKRYRPIQHIVGYVDFCGCRIGVDKTTLIPRPETEEIVMSVFDKLSERPPRRVLDLCTGSGCIAIAVAKHWREAEVTAVDVSSEALAKARQNADSNNVEVRFVKKDLLEEREYRDFELYDLIISNPPYVKESERREMSRNVLDWEPERALFVSDSDPLLFYRAIAKIAETHLSADGLMVLEINEKLGEAMARLLTERGFNATIYNDFRGRRRSVMAKKEGSQM